MKKNKILAGLSALVMGATMMAGTAMSASAADVYDLNDNYVGDGGFYTIWEDTNNDGVVDGNDDYTRAPYKHGIDMYDDMIDEIVDNGDGTYDVTFKPVTVYGIATGTISSVKDASNNELLNSGTATIYANTEYVITVDITLGFIHAGGHTLTVKLAISL